MGSMLSPIAEVWRTKKTLTGRISKKRRKASILMRPPTLAPRLIKREAAAAYVSVSPTKFDELVRDGRMPRPRCIDRRKAWDTRLLDAAVDDLPIEGIDLSDESWKDFDAP